MNPLASKFDLRLYPLLSTPANTPSVGMSALHLVRLGPAWLDPLSHTILGCQPKVMCNFPAFAFSTGNFISVQLFSINNNSGFTDKINSIMDNLFSKPATLDVIDEFSQFNLSMFGHDSIKLTMALTIFCGPFSRRHASNIHEWWTESNAIL